MPERRVFPVFLREGRSMEPKELETGTTTLGLACKDGTVLAADRRATAGTMIAHKHTPQGYKIDDNLRPTTAGLLEDPWTDDIDTKGGIDLAIRAVNAAMRRDAASGEGIDVAVISRDGYKDLDDKEVERRKTAMKLP